MAWVEWEEDNTWWTEEGAWNEGDAWHEEGAESGAWHEEGYDEADAAWWDGDSWSSSRWWSTEAASSQTSRDAAAEGAARSRLTAAEQQEVATPVRIHGETTFGGGRKKEAPKEVWVASEPIVSMMSIRELKGLVTAVGATQAMGNFTMDQLKAYCTKYDLKKTGDKRELIRSIAAYAKKVPDLCSKEDLSEIVRALGPIRALGMLSTDDLKDYCEMFGVKRGSDKRDTIMKLAAMLKKVPNATR